MIKWKLFFIVFLFSTITFADAKIIALRDVNSESTASGTDIVLTLSAVPAYSTIMVQNPNRFVLDLKNVRAAAPLHLSLPPNAPISDFRYATHPDGVFRIVFMLNHFDKPGIITLMHQKTHAVKLRLSFSTSSNSHVDVTPPQKINKPLLSDDEITTTSNKYRNIIVVIDPGHGGKDPGARGVAGSNEKNIVLSISKLLQDTINQQPGFHAVLTRSTDRYLTLRERLRVARQDKADIFVAIHADKWRNTAARGVSVFALSQRGATSEAARWLAKRENASELMGGVQLTDQSHLLQSILINLSQSATIRASLMIGKNIMQTVKPIARLHHPRVEQAAFVVLKSPDIPSLLVETGFLSNPLEEKKLCSATYQKALAKAIAEGVRQYFVYYPPRNTWLSYWKQNPTIHKV